MEEKLAQLKAIIHEVTDLQLATGLLGWDQQVYMPPAGGLERGEQMGTLSRLADVCLLRAIRRQFDKNKRIPASHVVEFAQVTAVAHGAWVKARSEAQFSQLQPHLEKIIELRREYASFFAPYEHVYDPLLDDFEPGMKTAEVKAIFNTLRPQQVALIQAILQRPVVDNSFLTTAYPEQAQWDFGVDVITRFGYDWKRGRQDKTAHPFTSGFGIDDVRITTRLDSKYPMSALFSTMHEAGHALYGLGLDRALRRTPLMGGASSALHESQSRMWENLVGRSRAFWTFFYPKAQALFPTQLGNVSQDAFYKDINKVEPSFIRVEADEATYNLHIMLRLELEIALMEGSLKVSELPDAWNTRMQEYLHLTPPNDSVGVLQDVHWSSGLIGYFPTYALGNLVSAQLWECIQRDIPDLEEQIMHGEFANLLTWLIQNVHRHGGKFEPQDLVMRITGSKIDPAAYVRYITKKYSAIYSL